MAWKSWLVLISRNSEGKGIGKGMKSRGLHFVWSRLLGSKMGALDADIAESLSDKLTLGFSDDLSAARLAFLETHFLWSPLLSMDAALTKHPCVIFFTWTVPPCDKVAWYHSKFTSMEGLKNMIEKNVWFIDMAGNIPFSTYSYTLHRVCQIPKNNYEIALLIIIL